MKTKTGTWIRLSAVLLACSHGLACGGLPDETLMPTSTSATSATNPDPMAIAEMRNDCMQNQWRLLGTNVSATGRWFGSVSTYGIVPEGLPTSGQVAWSPLEAETHQSASIEAHGMRSFLHLTGDATLPAACEWVNRLLVSSEGERGTDSYVEHEWILRHRFPTFGFPADASQIPTSTAPLAASAASTFTIESKKPVLQDDGTYDYSRWQILETRDWTLDDVTCEQGFTVRPRWDRGGSEAPFCRQNANDQLECLSYQVQYSADRCRFRSRDQSFRLRDGTTFTARLGGYFAQSETGQGYKVAFTNIEF